MQALVHSIFSYGCIIWLVGKESKNTVNKIIRACARFVTCKSKYDTISDDVNEFGWMVAKNIVSFELAKFTYKIINECAPTFFINYLNLEGLNFNTRNNTYCKPLSCPKTTIGKKSFRYRAMQAWLNLPEKVRSSAKHVSFDVFKLQTKRILIEKQLCERMIEIFDLIDDYEFENILL